MRSDFMIKAVLFDFDGTIGDTLPLVVKAIQQATEPFLRRTLSYDEIAETFGPSEEGSILKLVPKHYDEACKLFYQYYIAEHEMCATPYKGIIELIEMLKKYNVLVGLVTGKSRKTTDISLKKYNMTDIFDIVKTGSLQKSVKDECIKQILQKCSLQSQELIYIGDMPSDIDSARKIDVKIVSVLYATLQNEVDIKAKKPDKICYSVEELTDYLKIQIKK